MEELFEKAISEFKRVDHLLYVSLKYTRTNDVMISLIERVIATLDNCIEMLYEYKEIKEMPLAPVPRANNIKIEYSDDKIIQQVLDLYITIRKIGRSEKSTTGEFRRTLRTEVTLPDGEILILDIDTMQEYYNLVKDFLTHIREMTKND